MPATSTRRFPTAFRSVIVALLALTSFTVASTGFGSSGVGAAGVEANDWLGIVNTYRSQSGLAPVAANGSWATGTTNHSCWMLLNGIAHDEAPGSAGYTADGDEAGNSGNVAVSSATTTTARSNIDLWMSGPFHAIGILRPTLTQTSYGQCSSPPNPSSTQWKSGATLDVVRGNDWGGAAPASPIVFPGQGATTSLTRFVAESPDPRTYCGWTGRNVGLPLIALMPGAVTSATAVLNGPNGPVGTCVLTGSNTTGVASSILGGDNAVVVVPDSPLVAGTYSVSVNSSGGAANWSFKVDPNAPLAPTNVPQKNTTVLGAPAQFRSVTPLRFADSRIGQTITRLPAGQQVRIQVAGQQGIPADVTAVSANFTVAEPDGPGYLTAFNCSGSAPDVSTLNYRPGEAIANQAVIPLDNGAMCVFAYTAAHLIIDVNGYVSATSTSEFVPTDPKRLLDTRFGAPVQAGSTLRVVVEGGASPAPIGSDAVALNLTMADTAGDGWIRAFPCDAVEPGVSSVNNRAGGVRANSVIVPTAADGSICVTASVTTHVIVDITGWFGGSNGYAFVPLAPIRLADTRSNQPELNPAANAQPLLPGAILRVPVAGVRGVPANARAATVNLVALDAPVGGWLRVVPCGTASDVSNLNYEDAAPVANGANVKLSADGAICLTTFQPAHVIVDVTGVWL